MEVNEEKRKKFMDYAGKRVNNVLHDIQILEPMSRSTAYDFTKQDVEEMFFAMQECLNNAKTEFEKKFEEKSRAEKKLFSFGGLTNSVPKANENVISTENIEEVKKELPSEHLEETSLVEENIEETLPLQETDENLAGSISEMF